MTFLRKTSIWSNLLSLLTFLILVGYANSITLCIDSSRPLGPGLNASTFCFINLDFTFPKLIFFSSLSLKLATLSTSLSIWMIFSSLRALLLRCSTSSCSFKPYLPWKILGPHPISLSLNSLSLFKVLFYLNKNTSLRSSTKLIWIKLSLLLLPW